MSLPFRLFAGVCGVAVLLAVPALAEDAAPRAGGGHMQGGGSGGGGGRGPQGLPHMPPRGFRGVPPDVHAGTGGGHGVSGPAPAPHAPAGAGPFGNRGVFSSHGSQPSHDAQTPGGSPASGRFAQGRPGHDLGQFNGHSYRRFTPVERDQWRGGQWRHERHNGYLGWWWVVAGEWFFYPAPIYPYPMYVGPDYYYDYYQYYPEPSYYWYWCDDPEGYYPEVQTCNVPWQTLPPGDN